MTGWSGGRGAHRRWPTWRHASSAVDWSCTRMNLRSQKGRWWCLCGSTRAKAISSESSQRLLVPLPLVRSDPQNHQQSLVHLRASWRPLPALPFLTSFSGEEILMEGNGECIKHIWDRNPNWKSIEKLMFKASGRILVLVATFLSGCCWDRSEYGPSRTFGSFLDEWNSCRTFSFTYLIALHTYGYTICFYLYKSDIYIYIYPISQGGVPWRS